MRVSDGVGRTTTSGHEHGQRPQGDAQPFWIQNQPGFRFTDHPPGSVAFFAEIERHRYALEPATREMAYFARWRGHDVLEAGCGIATDGITLPAPVPATSVDLSTSALELAEKRFDTEGKGPSSSDRQSSSVRVDDLDLNNTSE